MVAGESIGFLRATIPSAIAFDVNIADDCKAVMGDKTQIHQVMINLFNNSAQAMQDSGGTLRFTLENIHLEKQLVYSDQVLDPGEHVHLTVGGTGKGIPANVIENVFDPFQLPGC